MPKGGSDDSLRSPTAPPLSLVIRVTSGYLTFHAGSGEHAFRLDFLDTVTMCQFSEFAPSKSLLQLSRRSTADAQALTRLEAGLDANPYAAALALEGLRRLKGNAAATYLARLEDQLVAAANDPGTPDTGLYRKTLKSSARLR
jgi:hypothetical protein